MHDYTLGKILKSNELLTLSVEERRRHLYMAGVTGAGKTSLLHNLMMHDLMTGRGFAFIDPHGDEARELADHAPPDRTNDVIYFDPLDPLKVPGFNPLKKTLPLYRAPLAAKLVSAFKHVWDESWGPRLEYVLNNAILLLLAQNSATILDIQRLLVDETFRKNLLKKCDDPGVKWVWEYEFANLTPNKKEEWISPIQNKAGSFFTNAILRAVVGQPGTIDVANIMNTRKVLIANFSKRMGEKPSHLLGAFLTTAFGQAAEERASIPEEKREDFTLYVDEFQNFTSEAFSTILSEARKWRLNLVIANQYLAQLDEEHTTIREAVMGNANTFVIFRTGAEDAKLLASQIGMPNPMELINTHDYHAWVKTVRKGVPKEPVSIKTLRPKRTEGGRFWAVIKNTHNNYARSRSEIEADFKMALPRRATKKRVKPTKKTAVASPSWP